MGIVNKIFELVAEAGKQAHVSINGTVYKGSQITINNDVVEVDGKPVSGTLGHKISIVVDGSVEVLSTTSGDVMVTGNAGRVSSVSGDVNCRDVSGDVTTTSGDIEAHSIDGNVRTVSGDINVRRNG